MMKTALSVPAEVLHAAERHARRVGKTRSEVFADAMMEYLARHASHGNGRAAPRKATKGKRSGVKARFTSDQLRQFMKKKPAPEAWFEEAAVDLTKPRGE